MNIIDRVKKRTHVPAVRLIPTPSIPDDCKIELTSKCDFKCNFCANKSREQGDMSEKNIKILLDACKFMRVDEVGLFLLGESLLRDDLTDIISYGKKIGIPYIYLTTNGYLCNAEKLIGLREAGLNSLKISLNAGTPADFKKVTGVDGYEKVMENIKYCIANKESMDFCVSCVYDDKYETELKKLENEMFFIGCDFYFLPKYNQGGKVIADVCGNPGMMQAPVDNIPCWELFNTMRFDWRGNMVCCSFPYSEEHIIGNISQKTIADLWNGEKFVKLRKAHLKNKLKGTVCDKCING